MSSGWRRSTTVLFLVAWGTNLAFDALAWPVPLLSPPHLLQSHMPEAIRLMISRSVLAPITSAVLAVIALLVLSIVPPGLPGRFLRLTAWLLGFWLLSEGLMAWVWLDAPGVTIAVSLAWGIPRAAAVAWVLERVQGHPAAAS